MLSLQLQSLSKAVEPVDGNTTIVCVWRMASVTSDLRVPSQLTLVPNYTAWWQRHMCRYSLDIAVVGISAGDPLIASPALNHSATEPYIT